MQIVFLKETVIVHIFIREPRDLPGMLESSRTTGQYWLELERNMGKDRFGQLIEESRKPKDRRSKRAVLELKNRIDALASYAVWVTNPLHLIGNHSGRIF